MLKVVLCTIKLPLVTILKKIKNNQILNIILINSINDHKYGHSNVILKYNKRNNKLQINNKIL